MAAISALLATWFTPSSLFIVVNIVIGTIAVTSRLASSSNNNNKQNHHSPPQLLRSPSLLQRARSFRLSYYYNDSTDVPLSETAVTECTHPQLVRTPSLLERLRSFNLGLHKHEPSQVAETEYEEAQAHEPESEEPKEPKLGRAPSLLQRLQSINLSRIYRSETVHVDEESEPEPEHEGPDPKAGVNVAAEMMRKSASERAREVRSEWEEDGERVEKRRPESARGETAWKREDEEVDAKADDFINRFKKQLRLQRVDSLLRYREMLRGN